MELVLLTQKQYIEKPDEKFTLELGETGSVYFTETIQRSPTSDRSPKLPAHFKIKKAKQKLTDEVKSLVLWKLTFSI